MKICSRWNSSLDKPFKQHHAIRKQWWKALGSLTSTRVILTETAGGVEDPLQTTRVTEGLGFEVVVETLVVGSSPVGAELFCPRAPDDGRVTRPVRTSARVHARGVVHALLGPCIEALAGRTALRGRGDLVAALVITGALSGVGVAAAYSQGLARVCKWCDKMVSYSAWLLFACF